MQLREHNGRHRLHIKWYNPRTWDRLRDHAPAWLRPTTWVLNVLVVAAFAIALSHDAPKAN